MKKFLKLLLWILLILLIAVAALLIWLSVTEFKPAPVESLDVQSAAGSGRLKLGTELDILSWNIGYGGLGKDSDFFMDGGTEVMAADKETVQKYLAGISDYIYSNEPDFIMLQEVDTDSRHSYGINQLELLKSENSAYAMNYSCKFVPFPWPPIGKVNSGLLTTTAYEIAEAERISLPCPFSWPVSTANLKRCLLVTYLPIEDSSKYLVLINAHLEAYDDGEGKIAQTNQLREFMQSEYEKGNYVIAGGDFNQSFPGSLEVYPNTHPDLWEPGILTQDAIPDGFSYAYDLSVPSCRLLNQPLDVSDTVNTQYYVIDGFIISPNVELNRLEGIDLGFENSDHNPVRINVTLK